MATVTFDAVAPAAGHDGAPSSGVVESWTHTCTGTDRLLIVGVSHGVQAASGATPTNDAATVTVTYAGVSMTDSGLGMIHAGGGTDGFIQVFYLVAPATGANTVAVSTTFNGGTAFFSVAAGAMSFTNADQSNPLRGMTSATGTGTAASVTVSAGSTDEMVFDFVGAGSALGVHNQTTRWVDNQSAASACGNSGGATAAGSASAVTMTRTISSDAWASIGGAIQPASTPGTLSIANLTSVSTLDAVTVTPNNPYVVTATSAAISASRSPSVTFGTAAATGDIVVFFPSSTTTAVAVAEPSGWVNILGGTTDVESDSNEISGLYHVVTSGENGTTTFTATNWYGAAQTGAVCAALVRNADPTTPLDVANSAFNSGNTTTPHTLPGLTPTVTGGLVLASVAKDSTGAYTTQPTGWTFQTTFNTNQGRALLSMDALTTASSAIGSTNITPSAGDEYASITAVFKPLSSNVSLVIADLTSAATVDNMVLGVGLTLAIADMTSAATIDNLTLTQAHNLTVADMASAATIDNLALTQVHVLAIDNFVSPTTLTSSNVAPPLPYPVPTSISANNQILDQDGNRYLMKGLSSWGFAQRATNAEITSMLERWQARGFNVINFAFCGGVDSQTEWDAVQYKNVAGQNFFTGTPFRSSMGAAFGTTDWIVSECDRLGMTAMLAFFISYGDSGARADIEAATNAEMRTFGQDVGTRYPGANIVFEVEADTGWSATDTIARRLDYFARGLAETRTAVPNLWFAESFANSSDGSMTMFLNAEGTDPTGYQWLHLCSNGMYWYGNDHVDQIDIDFGAAVAFGTRDIAEWDSEPGYAQANQYDAGAGGNQAAGVRQRQWSDFIRGFSGINWGHERWWCFDLLGLFPGAVPADWHDVPDSVEAIQAQYTWSVIDTYVKDVTWGPVSTLITSGQGTVNHEAAQGASNTAALAYFPSGTTNGSTARTIVVDTTIIAGTGNVQLRWFDPVLGTYSTIAASEAQNASRSVTLPAAHADGSRDFVLVVDAPPIALTIADLTSASTIDNVTLTQVHNLTVASMASAATVDNLALTQTHVLTVQDMASAATLDALTLTQVHVLTVQDLASAATLDNVVLSNNPSLTIQDLTSASTLDALALTQVHVLVMQDLTSASTVDNVPITTTYILVVADLTSGSTLDNVNLSGNFTLAIQDLISPETMDTVSLAQTHVLTLGDLVSATALDNITLDAPADINLVIDDMVSAISLDGLTFTQVHNLLVASLTSSTILPNVFVDAGTGELGSLVSTWVYGTLTNQWE